MDGSGGYHPERGNPNRKEQTFYELTDKWTLAQELRIPKIQFAKHRKLKKEDQSVDTSFLLRKWSRCPSTEVWIQKMWYIYTMEYYSAIKNNEFMQFLGKGMDLEDIILSEVTQSQKNSHDMHSLISGYYPRNLEYPRYNLQNTWNSRRKTKVWILRSFVEWGTKYPWKELQRQSSELRLKEGPSRDCPTWGSVP